MKNRRFNFKFIPFWRNNNHVYKRSIVSDNRDYKLYAEDYFHLMLSLEKKRAERSQNQHLLMLIDINKIYTKNSLQATVKKLIKTLFENTREVDIKGWYLKHRILGVIFPDVIEENKVAIMKKISDVMHTTLIPEDAACISISCFTFPEATQADDCNKQDCTLVLYQDLAKNRVAKRVSSVTKGTRQILESTFVTLLFSPVFIISAGNACTV